MKDLLWLLRENTYLWLNPGLTICISQASDQYACLPEGEPKYFCNFILYSKFITLGIFVSPYLLGCSDSPGTRISSSLFHCTTANWVLPGKWNKTHRKYKYFYPALCSWVWWSQVQVIFSHTCPIPGVITEVLNKWGWWQLKGLYLLSWHIYWEVKLVKYCSGRLAQP